MFYHAVRGEAWKQLFQKMTTLRFFIHYGHLLFVIVDDPGPWRGVCLVLSGGLTVAEVALKGWFTDCLPLLSTVVYLAMDSLVMAAVKLFLSALSRAGLVYFVAAGVLLTGNAFTYWRRLFQSSCDLASFSSCGRRVSLGRGSRLRGVWLVELNCTVESC